MRVGPVQSEIDVWAKWVGITPSPTQRAVLDLAHDVVLVAGGIGAGKSTMAAFYTLVNLPYTPRVWLVGNHYDDTVREFEELLRMLQRIPKMVTYVAAPKTSSRVIRTRLGNTIRTVSAADIRRISREGPNGIVMAEAAQQSREVFDRLTERLVRAEDPECRTWLFLSGTFEEGAPWYEDLYFALQGPNPWEGKSYSLPTWANPYLYPEGENAPAIRRARDTLPEDRFLSRFAGLPTVQRSMLVLPEFDPNVHVREDIMYQPGLPVQLWVDPGYSGSNYAAIAAHITPSGEAWVFDEVYVQYASHSEVLERVQNRPWWKDVDRIVIDVAAKQRTAAAKSPLQVWQSTGRPVITRHVRLDDGIARHREMLAQERIFISPRCRATISEYRRWKRKKIAAEGGTILTEPEKTNCDALKAINYGLMCAFGPVGSRSRPATTYRIRRWR